MVATLPTPERRLLVFSPGLKIEAMLREQARRMRAGIMLCANLEQLCDELVRGVAAVVLSEEALEQTSAFRCYLEFLDHQPAWSDLATILVLKVTDEADLARPLAEELLGNFIQLHQPLEPAVLRTVLQLVIRARDRQYQSRDQRAADGRAKSDLQARNTQLEQNLAEHAEASAVSSHRERGMRRLVLDLNQNEQRERRRMARVLHDHLQQILVATKLGLGRLRWRVDPQFATNLLELEHLLTQSIDVSRSLTLELSPPILFDRGLLPALEWMSRRLADDYQFYVKIVCDSGLDHVYEDARLLIFQATRELLFGLMPCSRGDDITLRLNREGAGIILTVRGPGLHGPDLDNLLYAGEDRALERLRRRLQLMGGSLELVYAADRHYEVQLAFPFECSGDFNTDRELRREPSPRLNAFEGERPFKVLLVDDHKILREGMLALLQDYPFVQVVGQATDGYMAIEQARALDPDVILMDITMPRMNGIEATRIITGENQQVRIVGLSMHDEQDMATAMRKAGASAYLAKGCPVDELLGAIRGDGRLERVKQDA